MSPILFIVYIDELLTRLSLFNIVIYRSSMLCQKARATGILLIRDIFTEAPQLSYTTFGFNAFNYNRYLRTYTDADKMCSNFIRDVRLFPQENRELIINSNSHIIFNTILLAVPRLLPSFTASKNIQNDVRRTIHIPY